MPVSLATIRMCTHVAPVSPLSLRHPVYFASHARSQLESLKHLNVMAISENAFVMKSLRFLKVESCTNYNRPSVDELCARYTLLPSIFPNLVALELPKRAPVSGKQFSLILASLPSLTALGKF